MDDVTFEDYVNVDDGACTMDYSTDQDMLASILDSCVPIAKGM